MSTERPVAERPADFFSNYNWLVGFTYAAIVVFTLGFFLHQIYQKRAEEIASILGHVERHGQLIEFVLMNSVDHLEASRITALDFYANTTANRPAIWRCPLRARTCFRKSEPPLMVAASIWMRLPSPTALAI